MKKEKKFSVAILANGSWKVIAQLRTEEIAQNYAERISDLYQPPLAYKVERVK